jgi:IS5 family transposase
LVVNTIPPAARLTNMIIDRYDPVRLFDLVPQLQLELGPELVGLDRLLDDDVLFQRVKADLARRAPLSLVHGRHSTPVEVILRMLVVRRLYHWSYADTEHFVSDSLVLRQFCRLGLQRAPDDTTLIRWAALIQPATLDELNEHVVALARGLRVTRGHKLRTDGTVVETTIHHPTDSSLLADGVRVLNRLIKRAKEVVGDGIAAADTVLHERSREARQVARDIGETARRRGDEAAHARRTAYARLVEITAASLEDASRIAGQIAAAATGRVGKLRAQVDHFVPLVEQVVDQTCRRLFGGETVPAAEKLVSLFEPHTQIICRGKATRPTEFGRKIWLDEVDGGIISRYQILDGNPSDDQHVAPTLAQHQRLFGQPPDLFAGDRGVHSAENELTAQLLGVKQVALPQPGARSAARQKHESQEWFQEAKRFRAGIEGRISGLKRHGYLGQCPDKGEAGFGRWIGWGILTANLATIARSVAAHP